MVRCAKSLLVLLAEVDAVNPDRDRASDGGLGDPAHAARTSSQHNVDSHGVYRARDFDSSDIDANALAEHVRRRGAAGDPRLRNGGYVIWNRRIAGPDHRGWQWRPYTGVNAHLSHVHVSVTDNPAHYDDDRPWGWYRPPAPAQPTAPSIEEDDMAKLVSADGEAIYVVTAQGGATHIKNARVLRTLRKIKAVPANEPVQTITQAELDALLLQARP